MRFDRLNRLPLSRCPPIRKYSRQSRTYYANASTPCPSKGKGTTHLVRTEITLFQNLVQINDRPRNRPRRIRRANLDTMLHLLLMILRRRMVLTFPRRRGLVFNRKVVPLWPYADHVGSCYHLVRLLLVPYRGFRCGRRLKQRCGDRWVI